MKASAVTGFCCLVVSVGFLAGQVPRNPGSPAPFGTTSHVLFGDIRVEEPEGGMKAAPAFIVTLEKVGGTMIGRDSVPANGRYRFNQVQNGEYVLTVMVDTTVVYREQFLLAEVSSTQIRRDIELVWSGGPEPPGGGTVYARPAGNQKKLDEARDLTGSGDHKKAAKLLKEVVKDDPEDFEARTELGSMLFLAGDQGEAEKAYLEALKVREDYLPALVNLGKVRVAGKRYQEAIEPLARSLELDPARAETNYLLGEAYLGIKKGSQAVGYLNEAIRLDPDGMADVHLRLGQLYDRAGMKDRAAAEYRQYLQKRPDSERKRELEKYVAEYGAPPQ